MAAPSVAPDTARRVRSRVVRVRTTATTPRSAAGAVRHHVAQQVAREVRAEHTHDADLAVGARAYVGAAAGVLMKQCSAPPASMEA